MASTSKAMMVSNGQGATAEIYDPETDLSANYGINIVDAKMENDGKPTSFYVVYDQLDFGQKEGNTTKAALVPSDPLSGSSEKVKFNFVPKSAQGFDVRDPGIVLFEHPGYKGNAMAVPLFQERCYRRSPSYVLVRCIFFHRYWRKLEAVR